MKLFSRSLSLEVRYHEAERKINALIKEGNGRTQTCKAEDDACYAQYKKALSSAIDLRDTLLEKLDKMCIDKLNSFPANRPCTIVQIARNIDVPWYRVKRIMIGAIPADAPNSRNIIHILNVIALGHVGKKVFVCDDYEIPVIILPNWRYVTSSDTDTEYVERIE